MSAGKSASKSSTRTIPPAFSRNTISSPRRKISTSELFTRNFFGNLTAWLFPDLKTRATVMIRLPYIYTLTYIRSQATFAPALRGGILQVRLPRPLRPSRSSRRPGLLAAREQRILSYQSLCRRKTKSVRPANAQKNALAIARKSNNRQLEIAATIIIAQLRAASGIQSDRAEALETLQQVVTDAKGRTGVRGIRCPTRSR